jgi:DsbC/DsbD-like thiol-disulfide interchange protein
MKTGFFLTALVATTVALSALPARAQTLSDIVSAEFLPGWRTEQGTLMAAVRLQLAPGWKTYWRSPGDAGVPPEFGWAGSDNIRAVQFHWPRPEVFDFNGMQTIGYARELVLPVEIWPTDASRPVRVAAQMDLGVCRDICVPASLEIGGDLLPGAGAAQPAIQAALRNRPENRREAGVRDAHCSVEAVANGMRLTAVVDVPRLGARESVVIETGNPEIWVAEASVTRDGSRLIATSDMISPNRQPFALDRSDITITVLSKGRAVELLGCPGN